MSPHHCRAQPCGPCTRRNEQGKCQWHIVEPMYVPFRPPISSTPTHSCCPPREKYVTRAEYDDLKARVEQLEQQLFRAPAGNVPQQYYQIPMNTGMPGGPPANVSSYNPPPHQQPQQQQQQQSGMAYQMMPPPPAFIQAPQPPQHRYPGPDSPRSAVSPRHMQPPNPGSMQQQQQQQQSPSTSPVMQHGGGGGGGSGSGPSSSRNPKSPQSASAKNSPLSLASITSPYNTADAQSKNCQRRRTLGERLRRDTLHEDPAVRFSGARRWMRPLLHLHPRRTRRSLWLGDPRIRVCRSRCRGPSRGAIARRPL